MNKKHPHKLTNNAPRNPDPDPAGWRGRDIASDNYNPAGRDENGRPLYTPERPAGERKE